MKEESEKERRKKEFERKCKFYWIIREKLVGDVCGDMVELLVSSSCGFWEVKGKGDEGLF